MGPFINLSFPLFVACPVLACIALETSVDQYRPNTLLAVFRRFFRTLKASVRQAHKLQETHSMNKMRRVIDPLLLHAPVFFTENFANPSVVHVQPLYSWHIQDAPQDPSNPCYSSSSARTSCCDGPLLPTGGEGPPASPSTSRSRWCHRTRPSRAGPYRPGRGEEELSPPTIYRD